MSGGKFQSKLALEHLLGQESQDESCDQFKQKFFGRGENMCCRRRRCFTVPTGGGGEIMRHLLKDLSSYMRAGGW